MFVGGIVVTGLALLGSAITGNVLVLLLMRTVTGISAAATFVIGAGIAARLGRGRSPAHAARLLGIYVAGGGLGIVASGVAVPPLLAFTGWRWGWVALAVATFLVLPVAARAAHAVPEPAAAAGRGSWPATRFAFLISAYALFGAGYIAYMTFVVALLRSRGAGTGTVTGFWTVLGAASLAGAFLWSPVLGRWRDGRSPATVMAVVTAGAVLPLVSTSPLAAFGSAVLFGVSFLTVVAAVTMVPRAALPPEQWTAAIATLTVAFAFGQCLGPLLAGVLADRADGVLAGLLFSAIVLAVGALIALPQAGAPPGTPTVLRRTDEGEAVEP